VDELALRALYSESRRRGTGHERTPRVSRRDGRVDAPATRAEGGVVSVGLVVRGSRRVRTVAWGTAMDRPTRTGRIKPDFGLRGLNFVSAVARPTTVRRRPNSRNSRRLMTDIQLERRRGEREPATSDAPGRAASEVARRRRDAPAPVRWRRRRGGARRRRRRSPPP
jgi:hypothetical protein